MLVCTAFLKAHPAVEKRLCCSHWGLGLLHIQVFGCFWGKLMREEGRVCVSGSKPRLKGWGLPWQEVRAQGLILVSML